MEDLDLDGKIILEWILEDIGCEVVNWNRVARGRTQWLSVVITIMSILGDFLTH